MRTQDSEGAPFLLPPIAAARARQLTSSFPSAAILVVGDAMVDKFIVGRVTRISPEAPVPVVAFDHDMHRMGGAANVASNVVALGGRVTLVAVTGRDEAAATLTEACREAGIAPSFVGDSVRPTTTKTRVVTDRNQQVARIEIGRASCRARAERWGRAGAGRRRERNGRGG